MRWRPSSVGMPPGCTAKARTPWSLQALVEPDGAQHVGGLGPAVGHPGVVGLALEVRDRRGRRRRSGGRPTRAARHGRRQPPPGTGVSSWMSRKWPRWLVPNWVSKPSTVVPCGQAITPALPMSTSSTGWSSTKPWAKVRTLARSARSSWRRSSSASGTEREDLLHGGGALGEVAHRHRHRRAVGGERPGRLHAETGRRAGDEDPLPGEVDPVEDVVGGALEPEAAHEQMLARTAQRCAATSWCGWYTCTFRSPGSCRNVTRP